MNLTDVILTPKADVVVKKHEPGLNKDIEDHLEAEIGVKIPNEAKDPVSYEPSDSSELSVLAKSAPLIDERNRPVENSAENSLVTTKYATRERPFANLEVTTTEIWDIIEPDITRDISEKELIGSKRGPVTRKIVASGRSSTNSDTGNKNRDKQFDSVSIAYTTIFLRLFAPDSTTTAEPKLGQVQQELPGQSLQPGDAQLKQNPSVGKTQTLDVEHKNNTTPSTTLNLSIPASSLPTRQSTASAEITKPTVSSEPASPKQELSTNATLFVVKEEVSKVSSSGTGIKAPLSPNTNTAPTTTAESGVTAGTLIAVIVPILIVILLMIFIAFIFVRRKRQFQKKRKRIRVDKEDVEEQIELNAKPEDPKNASTEKLYAKVDKSRKSRISTSEETTPLTTVLINGGPSLPVPDQDNANAFSPVADDLDFVDNDLYERDSDEDKNSSTEALAVANYPQDDETYEIPEDVVNQREHDSNDQLAPPVPARTSSSPRNSAYFTATPPVPHRHSSLALTAVTPPLPPRHSSLLSTPRRPASKSFDMLDFDRNHTPKLPPRHSLRLPEKAKSASPENKRATFAGHFVPMPLTKHKPSETSSESEFESSSESDFEELPPPRENAPPLPEGAQAANYCGANGGAIADESEYLEPVSLKPAGSTEADENDHDYDPVYIPSNPGASHIAHLVDNTNYLKGARNRSPSKASINPYEEIQFGTDVYADVDESTMTSPPIQESTPAPPRLTPRSSRLSDLVTPPQLSPRSPNSSNATPLTSRPTSETSDAAPQIPPRSPTKNSHEQTFHFQNGSLNLPKEPRYSGLLLDSEDELDSHDYTPLDYEDHDANDGDKQESANEVHSARKSNGSSTPQAASTDSLHNKDPQNDYDAVPVDNNLDEIYEPIEGADKDGIYEAIEFGDED